MDKMEKQYMKKIEADTEEGVVVYWEYDVEASCEDTLLRLNVKDDAFKVNEPCLNRVLRALDIALNEYNTELVELLNTKRRLIKMINKDDIMQLDELLSSLKDIKIKIHKVKEDINFCINKINIYTDYINA